ncbi:MAG TPA: hypothetical protein VGF69_25860 [Thermoanaerobaculia bacterium]|jgi:hypothetical protein
MSIAKLLFFGLAMLTIVTALAFLLLGHNLATRLWAVDELSPMERTSATIAFGVGFWIVSIWAMALPRVMTRGVVMIVTAGVLLVALALLRLDRYRGAAPLLWPLAPWGMFVAWRGWIVPPLSHDALAYHLPKAVLYARARGFAYFDFLDFRIRKLPATYELLLAENLVLEGTDRISEWFSLLFWVALAVGAGALVERWWKADVFATATTMLLVAGAPVALLHSGAHKNDLLVAAFVVLTFVWCGRFISTGDVRALFPLILATGVAVGTKPQAGMIALLLVPAAVVRLVRDRKLRFSALALLALFGIAVFLLTGGWVYLDSMRHADLDAVGEKVVKYGDWANLWQGPYVLVAAPFSSSPVALSVPWESEPWFWRRYEIFFSHLGGPFSLAALLLPFAVMAFRKLEGPRVERLVILGVSLLAVAIMLPVTFVPHGLYAISLPRYVLFLAPVVFAWTIAPVVIAARERRPRAGLTLASLAMVALLFNAIDNAWNDAFVPVEYVQWARQHEGTRVVGFDPMRAAEVFDRSAGKTDAVAVDAGFGAWLHPLFGSELQRPVTFMTNGQIPAHVRWVVVDRAWGAIWGHPELKDLSQARKYLDAGVPYPGDTRTVDALRHDPRWEVVFYNPRQNQAVFKRR